MSTIVHRDTRACASDKLVEAIRGAVRRFKEDERKPWPKCAGGDLKL
jgi:hypothetical protein